MHKRLSAQNRGTSFDMRLGGLALTALGRRSEREFRDTAAGAGEVDGGAFFGDTAGVEAGC